MYNYVSAKEMVKCCGYFLLSILEEVRLVEIAVIYQLLFWIKRAADTGDLG